MKRKLLVGAIFAAMALNTSAQESNASLLKLKAMAERSVKQHVNDVTGTPAQRKTLEWDGTQFDTVARNVYGYDSKKRRISDVEQFKAVGNYENVSQQLDYYLAANNTTYVDSSVIYTWNDDTWNVSQKLTFLYHDQAKGLYKKIILSVGALTGTFEFFYDNNNFIKYSTTKYPRNIPIVLPPNDSSVFQNDANGNPLVQDIYNWDDDLKVYYKAGRDENSFDANGNLLVNTQQDYDTASSTYINVKRITNTYNSSNNVVSQIDEVWSGESKVWKNNERITTFYKNVTEYDYQLIEKWDGTKWVNHTKHVWIYGGGSGIKPVNSHTNSFTVYPNPSSELTNIELDLGAVQHVKVAVLDVTGKQVLSVTDTKLSAGKHKLAVGTGNLAKGLYFINLNIDGKQLTQKLLVN